MRYLFASIIIVMLFPFLAPTVCLAADDEPVEIVEPKINIPIPTLPSLTKVEAKAGKNISIPWIAEYIIAIYRYLVIIGAVVATLLIMVGGIMYLLAGGMPSNVDKAKGIIMNALAGLAILLFSHLLLEIINPNLVNLKSIEIQTVQKQKIEFEETGDTETDIAPTAYSKTDVYCPKGGGTAEVPKIIASLKGTMYYRFGGKGGPPPYSEKKPEYMKYNNSCPGICLDCSGFVNFALKCAGLNAPGGGTGNIFSNAEKINSLTITDKDIIINNNPLKFGDLVGWKAGESNQEIGHVLMYVGDGDLAESHGGKDGREKGSFRQGPPSDKVEKSIKWVKRL